MSLHGIVYDSKPYYLQQRESLMSHIMSFDSLIYKKTSGHDNKAYNVSENRKKGEWLKWEI